MKSKIKALPPITKANCFSYLLAIFLPMSVLLEGFFSPLEYLAAVIVFLVMMLVYIGGKNQINGQKLLIVASVFVAISFISAWWGIDRGQGLLEAYRYLLYMLIFTTAMQIPQLQLSHLYRALFFTGVLLAIFGLSAIGSDLFISAGMLGSRLQGSFSYANTTAIYLLVSILFGLHLCIQAKGMQRIACIAGIYLAATALFLTGSRTVWLMWPLAILLSALFAAQRDKLYCLGMGLIISSIAIAGGYYAHLFYTSQQIMLAYFVIFLGLLVTSGSLYFLQDHLQKRAVLDFRLPAAGGLALLLGFGAGLLLMGNSMGRLLSWEVSELQGRLVYYTDAWSILRDHLWLGVGGGGWASLQFAYQTAHYNVTFVHSSILQVALDSGALGASLFSVLIALPFIHVCKRKTRWQHTETYCILWPALLGGILLFAHSLVDMDLVFPGAAGLLFFLLAVPFIILPEAKTPSVLFPSLLPAELNAVLKTVAHWATIALLAFLIFAASALWLASFYELLGDKSYNIGKQQVAAEYYQKSIKICPYSARTFNKLGRAEEALANIYRQKGLFESALLAYEKAHRLNDYQPEYLENLAYTYMLLGRDSESAEYFLELTMKNPMLIRNYENLAYVLIEEGEKGAGNKIECYEMVLEIPRMLEQAHGKVSPRGWKLRDTPQLAISSRLYWKLGQAEYRLGNIDEAYILWKKAIDDPLLTEEVKKWFRENRIDPKTVPIL